MLRMNASASIQKASTSGWAGSGSHAAQRTSRSKRTCSVSVGVKAVKSCVPASAAAQASSAARSSGCGHHSARPRSNALRSRRASTR